VAESLVPYGIMAAALLTCLIIPGAALLVALAAHEAGHFLTAWAAGFRLSGMKSAGGKYATGKDLYPCEGWRLATLTLELRKADHLPRRLLAVAIAGPLTSLGLAIALEAVAQAVDMKLVTAFGLHVLAGFSFLVGVAELLPDAGKGNF